jgi:Na+-transporting NADH:ubiquinone oxidoreductase subunit C
MIRQKKWFPVLYMFGITAFCSSIVIGFTQVTSKRVEANQKLAVEKAVLSVLPETQEKIPKSSGLEIHKLFTEKISQPDENSGGAYTIKQIGRIIAYALPIEGQGFWAPIKGIIGIKADKKNITGIYFYQQNETPGLGAEIAQPHFRQQFKDKVIAEGDKPFTIARPEASLDKSSVHAVTGATQTSTRLEIIINDCLKQWRQKLDAGGN